MDKVMRRGPISINYHMSGRPSTLVYDDHMRFVDYDHDQNPASFARWA